MRYWRQFRDSLGQTSVMITYILIVTRVALLTAFVVPQQNECHSASFKTSVISTFHGNSNFSIFSRDFCVA
jgi:hypothetical protein